MGNQQGQVLSRRTIWTHVCNFVTGLGALGGCLGCRGGKRGSALFLNEGKLTCCSSSSPLVMQSFIQLESFMFSIFIFLKCISSCSDLYIYLAARS